MEPFTAFASYATTELGPSLAIKRNKQRTEQQIASIRKLKSFTLGDRLVPPNEAFSEFLHLIPDNRPITIEDLTALTGMSAGAVVSAIAFGLKIGALSVDAEP
jgi:hypothetical protein